jgi:hypothetical protein
MSGESHDKIKTLALAALLKRGLESKNFVPTPGQVHTWKAENLPQKTEQGQNAFDLVLVAAEDDLEVTARYLEFYQANLRPAGIVVITKISKKTLSLFSGLPVRLLNENEIMEELTYDKVLSWNQAKTGWYFQQFLKMAYANCCESEHYLVFDGDTVPLNPLQFYLSSGKGLFIRKGEYFAPYFNMIEFLFDGKVKREVDFSFIAECMLINKRIMLEIISAIENKSEVPGKYFFEKILNCVLFSGLGGREFSEFETYGNYVMRHHKEQYGVTRVRSFREARKFFNILPEEYILDYLSRDFDMISFEKKHAMDKPLGLQEYINKCLTS